MGARERILAVAVLYKRTAEQSQSVAALRRLLVEGRIGAEALDLMICDNSPYEQPAPDWIAGGYVRDVTNPGLARCYNQALRRAVEKGVAWLMLLDQDTTVTEEYLHEVLETAEAIETAEALGRDQGVVAMVPKLIQGGVICSPIQPPRYGPARAVRAEYQGVAGGSLHPFNSGAVIRVSAIREIGGFPEEFPLDYLDHATFTGLQRRGGKLLVLRSELEHELSSNDQTGNDQTGNNQAVNDQRGEDAISVQRQASVLDAEYRFYARYGSGAERRMWRFRLLRAVLGRVLRAKSGGQSWRMLKSAMRR